MSLHPANTIIFLGPTLPHQEALDIVAAQLRAPAAIGDVYRAALEHPDAIIVIDGYFEGVPSLWHKEIMYAISMGIAVYGCASMGALRAAELHTLGMTGLGEIVRRYICGELTDDDEVAVAHTSAETSYRPVSHALVNIRYGLELATNRNIISAATRDHLTKTAKNMFYPDRHWIDIIRQAERQESVPRRELDKLADFIATNAPDLKRNDAVGALRALASDQLPNPTEPAKTFPRTHAWTQFELRERSRTG